jgi:Na+-driven multidrug efflux pump
MIGWGAGYGVLFSVVLLATRPALPALFGAAPAVRGLLLAVLLVVIVQQPVAGVVFVLDGVLIGAGDQDYLALAGLVTLAVFGAAATIVVRTGSGLVGLWVAYSVWMVARFVTLTLRTRSSRWLITGAVRR